MPPTDTKPLLFATLVLLTLCAGCASALREPPPLEQMAASARDDAGADGFPEAQRLWQERTLESVQAAAAHWQAAITDGDVQLEALLGATRARVWIADHVEDPDRRLSEAEEAVALGQWCTRVAPDEPECDYVLALALGLQARERRSTAIDALDHIVALLGSAIEQAPEMDHAGPHRVLALVYLRAPGWPTGPGDVDLGYEHAFEAVELAPSYPPNQLALAEAHRELDEIAECKAAYEEAQRLARESVARNVPDATEWLDEATQSLERLERR